MADPVPTSGSPDARSGEAMLRALLGQLAVAPPPLAHAAQLPTLSELAVLLPKRLPPWRVEAVAGLSQQLRAVLVQLGQGRNNDDVAHRMGLAKDTVETHCRALRTRLQVRTRAELMALAGLLSAVRPDV